MDQYEHTTRRAIIGKSLGDEVEIQRPAGKITAENSVY